MKKPLPVLFFLLVSLAILPDVVYLSGCKTAKENSYKTLSAIAHTVDTAMTAYADARVAGKVDDATHAKVVALKKQYEKAFTASVIAAQANMETLSSGDLVAIAVQIVEIVNSVTKK